MSDSEEDTSVLGKRSRPDRDVEPELSNTNRQSAVEDDQSDDEDDIGPMPMPDHDVGKIKKKRKGLSVPALTNRDCNWY